eukprot:gene21259-biopygen7248
MVPLAGASPLMRHGGAVSTLGRGALSLGGGALSALFGGIKSMDGLGISADGLPEDWEMYRFNPLGASDTCSDPSWARYIAGVVGLKPLKWSLCGVGATFEPDMFWTSELSPKIPVLFRVRCSGISTIALDASFKSGDTTLGGLGKPFWSGAICT